MSYKVRQYGSLYIVYRDGVEIFRSGDLEELIELGYLKYPEEGQ